MKHIKNFGEIHSNGITLKKYVIIKRDNNFYYLLEPIKIIKDFIHCKKLYTFFEDDKPRKNKQQFFNITPRQEQNIEYIYQSDNHQDTLDVFKSIRDSEKYNI